MGKQERLAERYLEAGIPFIMEGLPGIGKTAHLLDYVASRGMIVHDLRAALQTKDKGEGRWAIIQVMGSIREAEDIGGYPVRTESGLTLEPTIWAQAATHLADLGWTVVVFWDEFRDLTAPKQAALQKVMHENLCGDMYLNPHIRWAAAANSVEHSTSGVPISAPMANRLGYIPWTVNAEEWCRSMLANKYRIRATLSEVALNRVPSKRALMAAFIDKRRNMLIKFPEAEDDRDGPWPSPRSLDHWTQLAASEPSDTDWEFQLELMASIAGLGFAKEFVHWQRETDLPDVELVLTGKIPFSKWLNKDRPDIMYAVIYSVTSAVLQNLTPKRWELGWKFLGDCAAEGIGDCAINSVVTLMREGFDKENLPSAVSHLTPYTKYLKKAGFSL